MKLYTVNMAVSGKMEKGAKNEPSIATLDEAMLLTGFGIYNIAHMLLSGLILLGVIMQSLAMSYVMPAAQCDLNLSLQQRGWISAIPFLAIILTSYFWGWLADTRGRRLVMLISMIISTVFSGLASFAPEVISFAVLSFISSIFMSGSSAVVYTYLGEFTNIRHRDKIVTFGSAFVGIGTVIIPAIAWVILPLEFSYPLPLLNIAYRPWRLLVVACVLPFVIGTLLLIFIAPESPKFLSSSGKSEECLVVLRKMYSINRRMPEDTYPVKTLISEGSNTKQEEKSGISAILSSMKEQTVPLFKPPFLPWTCLTCFVQFGIFATTNGFYVWFPTILNSLVNHEGAQTRICDVLDAARAPRNDTPVECDDTINTATFEMSVYVGLVFCSMYIIVGFLVDFLGKKAILVVLLAGTGMCGVGAPNVYHQQIAVVLFAIFQMCGACIGLMNAVTVELFPTKFRAMAVCLSMMMGRVGSMVGTNLIGLFLETNCGVSFYLFAGVIMVCALFCLTLPGKNKGPIQTKPKLEATQNETQAPA
ncbi:organic cation/carnitine transporter 7-like isoform X1 [Vanessa atalanta]|uniref:organic cation/carnitine transporter 7-like isoform X1 n=2 Tax=Vanessa atalanta TaxID=42275 RepID=UPI001FCDD899|nr:organic cation/carnitine transporter 7-like isoform X1 [Vanessa atalanta]